MVGNKPTATRFKIIARAVGMRPTSHHETETLLSVTQVLQNNLRGIDRRPLSCTSARSGRHIPVSRKQQ